MSATARGRAEAIAVRVLLVLCGAAIGAVAGLFIASALGWIDEFAC